MISPHRNVRVSLVTRALLVIASAAISSAVHAQSYVLQRSYYGEFLLDQFGFAVASIGDVTGDGIDDFAVGANVNDELIQSGGKSYLFRGGVEYALTFDSAYAGALDRGYVGQSISGGADFNGDGYADWAVGASGGGPSGTAPGRTYLFLGGPAFDQVPDLVIEGRVSLGQFGFAISLEGDLDGDGFGDLCVGAPRDSAGAVYIFHGSANPDSTADAVLRARANDQRFGASLAILPDDDGDLRDDLLVGSPKSTQNAVWDGAVLLYRGSSTTPSLVFAGENAGDEFGTSIWAGGDVTGDGGPDVLVGAPVANVLGITDAGKAYVFAAGAALDSIADVSFSGTAPDDQLGLSVTAGFDWNGDGHGDLALGVPNKDTGGIDTGRFEVHFGGAAIDNVVDHFEDGATPSLHLGTSVANAGDIRHNGRGALIVGGYNGTNNGAVLLYGSNDVATSSTPDLLARLDAPYPNPFNPRVQLSFEIPTPGATTLRVFDPRGRLVRTLMDGTLSSGFHRLTWTGDDDQGRSVASGTYHVELRHAQRIFSRTVTLIR